MLINQKEIIIEIRIKSVFEINELHLKFVDKLKGCSSDHVPNGILSNSYII
jgi:hypothetical protein